MRRLSLLTLLVLSVWLTTPVYAATLNYSGSDLIGASDFLVNGDLCNVEFGDPLVTTGISSNISGALLTFSMIARPPNHCELSPAIGPRLGGKGGCPSLSAQTKHHLSVCVGKTH
jgi:hypothetical protein